MLSIFRNARLKVKRANEHIDDLIQRSSPLSTNLYEITNGPARSIAVLAQPDCFQVVYRPNESITDAFSPIIGDIVNNLRESMDHWINAVDRERGGRGNLHFLFSSEWKNLESSRTYGPVKKSFPELARLIVEHIKPCRDTNLELWAATSLCNLNKHNDFVPTVTLVEVENINATIGASVLKNCGIGGDANSIATIIHAGEPIHIHNNFCTTVHITFPEGAVFENQPVVPTLAHMSQVVSQTLDVLEEFVKPYLAINV